jgi:hypothetical protein
MIRATVTAKIYACARLRPGPTGLYAVAFARSRDPDGTLQVVRLWTADPELMETLLWCEAGAAVTASGRLRADLCVPVGGTEQRPVIDLRIESLEVASSLALWFPPRAA